MVPKSEGDDRDEPSLELPTLSLPGLRRRKKPKEQAAPEPRIEQQAEPQADQRAQTETAEAPRDENRRRFLLPAVAGTVAAVVTGVLVGVLGTLLTFLALTGCELLKGTSTCGGPGFFLLVAIVIVMILAGAALLKAWRIADPGSTSFLAVGVVAVIVLVVLIDVIFSGWMFLVVPVVSAAAYALSQWVTTRFVEDESPGVGPDVR